MSLNYTPVMAENELQPGRMKCIDTPKRKVLIANVEGQFYAVDDMCTHEDASLSTGCLRDAMVTCPLHGSRFELKTGRPLDEPAEIPLRTYPVKVEKGQVCIAMDGE